MLKESLEEWRTDIHQAQNTHPNAFANGPIVRSLFKVTEEIGAVGQQIMHLSNSLDKATDEFHSLNENIKTASKTSGDLSNALNRITFVGTIIAAGALLLEAIKYFS